MHNQHDLISAGYLKFSDQSVVERIQLSLGYALANQFIQKFKTEFIKCIPPCPAFVSYPTGE